MPASLLSRWRRPRWCSDHRTLLRRIRLWTTLAVAFLLFAPVVVGLVLNFVQPPTTMIMLQRAFQRSIGGDDPWYPRRVVVDRKTIPAHVRRAVLAAEDDRFYLHDGLDFIEIQRALDEAERGRRLRGASTITQQVAKNLFLWEGRSFVRKALEAYLTIVLEITLPKDRILDLYLNLAEWGDGVFGIEMAARTHFRTSTDRLTREQAARLAAILPSPRRWSPMGVVAERRLPVLLDRMRYAVPR